MPADTTLDLLPAETAEPPAARRDTPQEQPDRRIDIPAAAPEKASLSPRRRFVRWAMFTLLPLALIGGAYWYVTGGQVMSTDDAYVNAETVGISTDVSGIVQQINVAENQHVDNGQVLYRLDPRQFQIALDNARAVTSGVDLPQNHRVKFREAASAYSPDPIEDAAVLGPIKAKPFGWPRKARPALTGPARDGREI